LRCEELQRPPFPGMVERKSIIRRECGGRFRYRSGARFGPSGGGISKLAEFRDTPPKHWCFSTECTGVFRLVSAACRLDGRIGRESLWMNRLRWFRDGTG
jgi:hypothetical protein